MDNQPEEKKDIPTPPPPKVSVRTMQSDMKSIQETGGQNPQPYTTEINQPRKEAPLPATPEEISFQPSENIPGYVGPEEPIFKPGGAVGPLPPQPPKPGQAPAAVKPPKKGGSKVLIIGLVIVILVVAVLGVGYYFYQKQKSTSVATPESTVTAPTAPVTPPKPEYLSLFKTSNLPQAEETIASLSIESIKNALTIAAATIPTDTFKEIVLRNPDNSLVSSYKLFPILLPELAKEDLTGVFEQNSMIVIFVDKNGSWPAYVFQLKTTANVEQAQALIKNDLETSVNLKNIFLVDPGTAATAFKDGQAGSPSVKTRYLTFSNSGAALNYGWANGKLVISSNYAALQQVLSNL